MEARRLTCLLLVFCAVKTQSQSNLEVRWNNDIISRDPGIPDPRVLIYHDEINIRTEGVPAPDNNGVLVCMHSGTPGDVEWLRPGSAIPLQSNNNSDFRIIRQAYENGPTRSQLARVVQTPSTAGNEGLWSCNGGGLSRRYVSLYRRGRGRIANVEVSLQSSSFGSNRFTLVAETTGGPPTTFSWRRNNGGSLISGVSIEANPDDNQNDRENCLYRSTLRITGSFPGVYEYRASNRATIGNARRSLTIEGGDPSNLQIVQTGMNIVRLTWQPPPGPPSQGYRVTDSGNNIDRVTMSTSLTIDALPLGNRSFQVTSLSQHFPEGMVGPRTITVRGVFTPNITLSQLTATSIRVSWSPPPMFSFTVARYTVAIKRLTACGSVFNVKGPREQNATDRTELLEGLEEYFDYKAEVGVYFESQSYFYVLPVFVEMGFTTQGFAPSEVPSYVRVLTVTSKLVQIFWDDIDDRNKNGPNFHYEVEFQRMDGGAVPVGAVHCVLFTVEGLQPFTSYTIRVRGVNDVGNGDYTDTLMIPTNEDTPGSVVDLNAQLLTFTSVLVTWSPPQEPNGIITAYELMYQANEDKTISKIITNRLNFTIVSEVNTRIEVRVRAYTNAGPGLNKSSFISLSLPIVMNVTVKSLTDTSVIVSWDRITDSLEIVEYIVYYAPISSRRKKQDNEQSVTVPSTENSVEIANVRSTVLYQYQVTMVAMIDGRQLEGERSPVTKSTKLRIRACAAEVAVSVSVAVSVLLTIILNNTLLLVGCCIAHTQCNKPLKQISDDNNGIAMKENSAYVPVTLSQQIQDNIYDDIIYKVK